MGSICGGIALCIGTSFPTTWKAVNVNTRRSVKKRVMVLECVATLQRLIGPHWAIVAAAPPAVSTSSGIVFAPKAAVFNGVSTEILATPTIFSVD